LDSGLSGVAPGAGYRGSTLIILWLMNVDDSDIPYLTDPQKYHDLNNCHLIGRIDWVRALIHQKAV